MQKINTFLIKLKNWAAQQNDVTGLLLVGSYARSEASKSSDIDLVLLCDKPETYLSQTDWLNEFGMVEKFQIEHYGNVTSLRTFYKNGIEIEWGITTSKWAERPVDSGTRKVINHGVKIIYDPFNELNLLIAHINNTNPAIKSIKMNQYLVKKAHFTSCIILTKNNELLFQQRGHDWNRFPGYVSTFGGAIESGETPIKAMIRELHEELGAKIGEDELIFLSAYTEAISDHKELVFGYFWHDFSGKISGCYEGEALYFSSLDEVYQQPLLMDDVPWLLTICRQKDLLNRRENNE